MVLVEYPSTYLTPTYLYQYCGWGRGGFGGIIKVVVLFPPFVIFAVVNVDDSVFIKVDFSVLPL